MDVKGGMILGLVVALLVYNLANAFDDFMLGTPYAAFLLAAFASFVLVLRLAGMAGRVGHGWAGCSRMSF